MFGCIAEDTSVEWACISVPIAITMADYMKASPAANVEAMQELGARIVGACCGSTAAHIALFRAVLDREKSSPAKPS